MTIKLTLDEFYEQFQEAEEEELQWDVLDDRDSTYKFDTRISHGWRREIELREGLWLFIDRHQQKDRLVIKNPEREKDEIYFCFMLSGKGRLAFTSTLNNFEVLQVTGKYYIETNGTSFELIYDHLDLEPCSFVEIEIKPEILRSFAASPERELPKNLQHLIKSPSQKFYWRQENTQPSMNIVLQQILQCPYQGIVKRAYLESKAIELISLVLDHEIAIGQGETKKCSFKPDQLERIHYAKEILLQDLNNPPSLQELSRQAGLNDFILKQGFHHCFGTSVFAVLRSHRLELAKQLLAQQDTTVTEVAHQVGYGNVRSFARAFKRKFGLNPKEYQKASR
ncbi:MAG: helix-turn-helix transcriptional regulator [Pleurocapsa sp.]